MQDVRKLIHTKKPGVSDLDIQSTEPKLGALFPEQYRELMKMVNNPEFSSGFSFLSKILKILRKLGMILLDKTKM